MPFCLCEGGGSIYYEVHGEGIPLLLISGLSGGTWSWFGQVPFFEPHYRVITFDNRGAGRSHMPPGPYRMLDFATEALCLLDCLGVDRAFVLALSMGGMIAQELALLAPGRIRALVLGCTNCGGSARIPPAPEIMGRFVDNESLSQEEIVEKNLPFFLSRETLENRPDVVQTYRNLQLQSPLQPEYAFHAQLQAIRTFDCCGRLSRICAPTLAVTGTEDVLVPPENARYLANHIPGAELTEIPGAGHALHVECRDRLNELALDFFRRYRL